MLDTVFGTSAAAAIVGFTVGGDRPYDPTDQGTLPPWFANSPPAAAVSTLINDFVFRCGRFLATDNVVATPGAERVYAYLFAQAPIYSSDGSTACAPFPADPGIQNACHSFERPYVFNTLSATNATVIPPANAQPGPAGSRATGPTSPAPSAPARAGDPYRAHSVPAMATTSRS